MWQKMIFLTLFTLLLTGCSFMMQVGVSIQNPDSIRTYIEQRACSQAQDFLVDGGFEVAGIPCDIVSVDYVDADWIPCGDITDKEEYEAYYGCFIHTETTDDKGLSTIEYEIGIASRHWGWENTLVHEYCHFLLAFAGYEDWTTPCHVE